MVDPKSGYVVATGIGTARITVTDSLGAQAGYNITFTGIVRPVERIDNQGWPPPASDPTRPEHHSLTRAQMMAFWNVYRLEDPRRSVPQILGWPESDYWSGENIIPGSFAWAVEFSKLSPDFEGIRVHGGVRLPSIKRIGW